MEFISPTTLSNVQVVFYVNAGFLTLLVYDILLKLSDEYLYIWKSRWTVVKVIYFWSRYSMLLPPIISTFNSFNHLAPCDSISRFTTTFGGFSIGLTEVVLMVRTYTLYERSRRLLAFFSLMWLAVGVASFWAVSTWTSAWKGVNDESAACYLVAPSTSGKVCYLSLLVGESIIALLTAWKVFRRFSRDKWGLWKSLNDDGLWFYLCLLPFTVNVVVCLIKAPSGLGYLGDTPNMVMHSILTCRLLIHARHVAAKQSQRALPTNNLRLMRRPGAMAPDYVIDISAKNNALYT
ncbi:unnamed protein product [Mycena citricolor]|uniref:DUF6533 domain-containing protein n=2 Tax=Mycena citricolor TaxID=2018698 RepID=A0AAD2H7K9_9AGAR|nr:unnamed protein product [Mycena citricolor]